MKRFLFLTALAAFVLSFAANVGLSKTDNNGNRNYPFSLGPYLTAKCGVNANDVPTGTKNGVLFNGIPDFGVTGYIPLGKDTKLGLTADLGYNTFAYEMKLDGLEGDPWGEKFSYLVFSPNLHISGFTLGFAFGLPMSATREYSGSSDDLSTDKLATMIDIHLGGMIPVVEGKAGRLNIVIQGGYFLSGLFKDEELTTGKGFNRHPAHLELGLNYLFNLTKK